MIPTKTGKSRNALMHSGIFYAEKTINGQLFSDVLCQEGQEHDR